MANKKNKGKGPSVLAIIAIIVAVLLVVVIAVLIINNKDKDDLAIPDSESDRENDIAQVDNIIQDIKETIVKKTCEERAQEMTPDRIILLKNSLDPLWSIDTKNKTLNYWADGTPFIPVRFIRYQLSTGNVFRAEKPLISTTEAHYYIYKTADLEFEINPALNEETDTLEITQGYGGRTYSKQEFSIADLGLVSCKSVD